MLPVLPVTFVSVWQQNRQKPGAPILQLEGCANQNPGGFCSVSILKPANPIAIPKPLNINLLRLKMHGYG
jgi:hypothetical protein